MSARGSLRTRNTRLSLKACAAEGLWLRSMFEVAYNLGWPKSELLNLRVRQVDLASRTIRLEVDETKNNDGRTAVMTSPIYALLQQCVLGKQADDHVFTRDGGQPAPDFPGPGIRSAQRQKPRACCSAICAGRPCETWCGVRSPNA